MMVMQQLLEDVTGTPFRDLARELVLDPLGMADSDYAQPLPEERHDRAATAHDEAGRPIEGRRTATRSSPRQGSGRPRGDLAGSRSASRAPTPDPRERALARSRARAPDDPDRPRRKGRRPGSARARTVPRRGGPGDQVRPPGGNEGFRCHLLAYRDTGQGAVVMTNGDNGNWRTSLRADRRGPPLAGLPTEVAERDVPDAAALPGFAGTYGSGTKSSRSRRTAVTFSPRLPAEPIEFMPQSADSFAGRTVDTTLRFDRSGDALTLIVSQNGAEIVRPRARG